MYTHIPIPFTNSPHKHTYTLAALRHIITANKTEPFCFIIIYAFRPLGNIAHAVLGDFTWNPALLRAPSVPS